MELLTIPVGPLECNCYVLWEDPQHAFVVDPGDEPAKIVAALEKRGIRPRVIVSTHGHFDHVGAVDALCKRFEAPYKIHRADVPILQMVPARTKLWGITVPDIPEPKQFLEPGETWDLKGLRVEAVHTPGHTPGSTSFLVRKAGLVMTGDTLFLSSIGRTDFPGGDPEEILRSIHGRLYTLPATTNVLPGHGPPTTIEQEKDSNPFT